MFRCLCHAMFVIDHKENVSLNRTFFICDLSQTFVLLQCFMLECSVISCGKGWLLGNLVAVQV